MKNHQKCLKYDRFAVLSLELIDEKYCHKMHSSGAEVRKNVELGQILKNQLLTSYQIVMEPCWHYCA